MWIMILKWNISYIINVMFIAKTVLNASKSMWNIMLISVEVCEEVVTFSIKILILLLSFVMTNFFDKFQKIIWIQNSGNTIAQNKVNMFSPCVNAQMVQCLTWVDHFLCGEAAFYFLKHIKMEFYGLLQNKTQMFLRNKTIFYYKQ